MRKTVNRSTTIYICDSCKKEFKPEFLKPTKQGETIYRLHITRNEILHEKDQNALTRMYGRPPVIVILCSHCEAIVKTLCNLS